METLTIEATERSPEIDFDFKNNTFSLQGESYPEDISEFYGPVIEPLEEHLRNCQNQKITFNFELIYFNSSSAKILMGIFDLLDETAENENTVIVNWYFIEDDDNMEELGEEFGEDLEYASFNLIAKADE